MAHNITGGQRVVMRVDDEVTWFHTDHLGSTGRLSDAAGEPVPGSQVRLRSVPYGEYRTTPTANLTDVGFTGHRDTGLGLIFMRARYCVQSVGRFASADSIVPDPLNPQSLSRYTYVLGNPLRYRDLSGHAYDADTGIAGSYEVDDERLRWFVESGAIPESVAILSEYYYPLYKEDPKAYRGTPTEMYAGVYSEYALGRNLNHPDAVGFRFEVTIPGSILKLFSPDSVLGGLASVDVNFDFLLDQDSGDTEAFVTVGPQVGPAGGKYPNISFGPMQVYGINDLSEHKGLSSALGVNVGSLEVDFSQALDPSSLEPWHSPTAVYWGISSPAPTPTGYSVPVARTWTWDDFKQLVGL